MTDTYADLRALAEGADTMTDRDGQRCIVAGLGVRGDHEWVAGRGYANEWTDVCAHCGRARYTNEGRLGAFQAAANPARILALLADLDAARGEVESTAESLGGMVEWLAEVVVDTREALRVGGCGEHMLTAEQMGALEAATRILSRERNAHPSRYDRMKAERDALAAEVEAMRAILAGLVRRALDGTP